MPSRPVFTGSVDRCKSAQHNPFQWLKRPMPSNCFASHENAAQAVLDSDQGMKQFISEYTGGNTKPLHEQSMKYGPAIVIATKGDDVPLLGFDVVGAYSEKIVFEEGEPINIAVRVSTPRGLLGGLSTEAGRPTDLYVEYIGDDGLKTYILQDGISEVPAAFLDNFGFPPASTFAGTSVYDPGSFIHPVRSGAVLPIGAYKLVAELAMPTDPAKLETLSLPLDRPAAAKLVAYLEAGNQAIVGAEVVEVWKPATLLWRNETTIYVVPAGQREAKLVELILATARG